MKPTLAVYKFTSCDGCQLAFLNAGEALLSLAEQVDIVHFAEAGVVNPNAAADITFIEGSISTPEELTKIQTIRKQSKYLITIGACATAGGIQALRNAAKVKDWIKQIYAKPEYIESLSTSTAISQHVKVDFELWGCPVTSKQVFDTIRSLLFKVTPHQIEEPVCMECKRQGNVCVLVTEQQACMGPVTQTGCGAICPHHGRACYACFGPSENPNAQALTNRLIGFGLTSEEVARRFVQINSQATAFKKAAKNIKP